MLPSGPPGGFRARSKNTEKQTKSLEAVLELSLCILMTDMDTAVALLWGTCEWPEAEQVLHWVLLTPSSCYQHSSLSPFWLFIIPQILFAFTLGICFSFSHPCPSSITSVRLLFPPNVSFCCSVGFFFLHFLPPSFFSLFMQGHTLPKSI